MKKSIKESKESLSLHLILIKSFEFREQTLYYTNFKK